MRGLWSVLGACVIPFLAGCAGPAGALTDLFDSPDPDLDGLCGHVYNPDWDKQIFLEVTLAKQAAQYGPVTALDVAALYMGDDEPRRYHRDRSPDTLGCLAFPLQEAGGYNFWAFGEIEGSNCFLSGYIDGAYNGKTEIVTGTIVVSRQC